MSPVQAQVMLLNRVLKQDNIHTIKRPLNLLTRIQSTILISGIAKIIYYYMDYSNRVVYSVRRLHLLIIISTHTVQKTVFILTGEIHKLFVVIILFPSYFYLIFIILSIIKKITLFPSSKHRYILCLLKRLNQSQYSTNFLLPQILVQTLKHGAFVWLLHSRWHVLTALACPS